MDNTRPPAVGIALVITWHNRLMVGRRVKPPMEGSWQLPGGWLGHGETLEQAVQRKVAEFPGMVCDEPVFQTVTNNRFDDGLHSVSLYFQMACLNADDIDIKANKHCSDWFWADWYDLPDFLFLPLSLLRESGWSPG